MDSPGWDSGGICVPLSENGLDLLKLSDLPYADAIQECSCAASLCPGSTTGVGLFFNTRMDKVLASLRGRVVAFAPYSVLTVREPDDANIVELIEIVFELAME